MEKVLTFALAIVIFISSAAADPIQMTDGELDVIHSRGYIFSSPQFALRTRPDGSAALIQNGVEYEITGSNLSLPDGTQVQINKKASGFTILVTNNGVTNISGSVSVIGGDVTVTWGGTTRTTMTR